MPVRDTAPPVIDLDLKTFGEEAVGFREGGGDDVREGFGDAGCQGVR